MCFGSGASLNPEAALRSALVEIATDAPSLARRAQWSLSELSAMAADFEQVTALHDHPHLYGLPEMARYTDFLLRQPSSGDLPLIPIENHYADPERFLRPTTDLRDDLTACVEAVAEAGFDVVVVDQTIDLQRRFGLHTVQVVVPGLLPIDFGWIRQRAPHLPRMRTALREAGRRTDDLLSVDLNPAPHPFP
jgi:ribosomal protein S12 methylthiotransferase accessory factor